jgi:hypothetical protein
MSLRTARLSATAVAITSVLLAHAVPAQTPTRKDGTASVSISGVYQSEGDLDGGGNAGWSGLILNGAYSRPLNPKLDFGFTLHYDYQGWTFSDPAAFGGTSPWKNINTLALGLMFDYAWEEDLRLGVSPVFGWSYEVGASSNDVLDYGAILTATKIFSPRLALGAGVGVFRQLDETKVFPVFIVRWQIDDKWRLANPFRAGPSGGAGLELVYAINDNWEVAGGAAYRSYRFRMDDQGFAPRGVGENRFFPVFASLTRKIDRQTRLTLYAGTSAGGQLSVADTNGNDLVEEDYASAPAIGLTLSHRF